MTLILLGLVAFGVVTPGVFQVLGIIGSVIGIVSFIGLAFVFLRGSADKGTMESQDRSIAALTTELGIEREKRIQLQHQVEVCEAEIAVWKASVQHLPELATLQTSVDRNSALLGEILTMLKGTA